MIHNTNQRHQGFALPVVMGAAALVVAVAVLGAVVWRVQQERATVGRPKAIVPGGQCLPAAQTHLECDSVYLSCIRKIGAGANQHNCTTVGQTCTTVVTSHCVEPGNSHLECINNTCVRKRGAGGNLHGCTSIGQSCTVPVCTSDSQCDTDRKCVNGQCVDACQGVNPPANACKQNQASNHQCTEVNKPNGTACTATGGGAGTCQNGSCVSGEARECEVCEGFAGRRCTQGLECLKLVGASPDQGGVCVKTDGSSVCGPCTTDANCTPPLVCAEGVCADPRVVSCIKEGQTGSVTPTEKPCCAGLTKINCARPDAAGVCPPSCVGAFVCTKCGNGTCGPGENKCNCPADCITEAQECEVCEGFAGKPCASGLSCFKVAEAGPDQGGICMRTDGTSVCGSCTTDNNCVPPLVCAEGGCVELGWTHLVCGQNYTCVRKRGAGSNENACTQLGAACTGCQDTVGGPALVSPENGATDVVLRPTFSWIPKVGTCGTDHRYTLYLDKNASPAAAIASCTKIATTSCTLAGDLDKGTAYYWRVLASRGADSGWSLVRSLTTRGATEIEACWGNGGGNGRCYDCNGDGYINILDFSCFAKRWLETVMP